MLSEFYTCKSFVTEQFYFIAMWFKFEVNSSSSMPEWMFHCLGNKFTDSTR